MITAMPSPRGSNSEKLFILRGHAPGLAQDASPLPGDPADDENAACVQVVRWAQENLSAPALHKLASALTEIASAQSDAPASPVPDDDAQDRATHGAGRVPVRTKPLALAGDGASQSFNERYPEAARIDHSMRATR